MTPGNASYAPYGQIPATGLRKLDMDGCADEIVFAMFRALAGNVSLAKLRLTVNAAPRIQNLYAEENLPHLETLQVLELTFVRYAFEHRNPLFPAVAQRFPNLTTFRVYQAEKLDGILESDAEAIASLQHLRDLYIRMTIPSYAVLRALLRAQLHDRPTWTHVHFMSLNTIDPGVVDLLVQFIESSPFLTKFRVNSVFPESARMPLTRAMHNSSIVQISFDFTRGLPVYETKNNNALLTAFDPEQTMDVLATRVLITGPQRAEVGFWRGEDVMFNVDEASKYVFTEVENKDIFFKKNASDKSDWWSSVPRDARHFYVVRDSMPTQLAKNIEKPAPAPRRRALRVVVPYVVANDALVRALLRPDRDVVVHAAGGVAELRMPGGQVARVPLDNVLDSIRSGGEDVDGNDVPNAALSTVTLLDAVVERALMCAAKPVLTREEAEQIARDCDPGAEVPDSAPTMYTFASGALAVRLPVLLDDLAAQFANPITVPRMGDAYMRRLGRRPMAQDRAPAVTSRAIVAEVFYKVAKVGADVVPVDEAVAFMAGFELVFKVKDKDMFVYRNSKKTPALLYRMLALMLARNPTTQLVADQYGYTINFLDPTIIHPRAYVESGQVVVDAGEIAVGASADANAVALAARKNALSEAAADALAATLNALLLT